MRPLGEDLGARGATVLGIRLTGRGTHPRDLGRTRHTDWLVGQSLGSMVMLLAASYLPVGGVVALSPPFDLGPPSEAPAHLADKEVEPHPELGVRREADYPAYAATHTRAEREIFRLHEDLLAALPGLRVSVLLVSSHGDPWFPPDHGRRLLEVVGSERKELVVLERAGHASSLDPERGPAVEAIERFASRL
jgi:carboxylesterase